MNTFSSSLLVCSFLYLHSCSIYYIQENKNLKIDVDVGMKKHRNTRSFRLQRDLEFSTHSYIPPAITYIHSNKFFGSENHMYLFLNLLFFVCKRLFLAKFYSKTLQKLEKKLHCKTRNSKSCAKWPWKCRNCYVSNTSSLLFWSLILPYPLCPRSKVADTSV